MELVMVLAALSPLLAVPLPFNYMAIGAVLDATGIGSKSSLYAKIKAGQFPEPDRLGFASRWRSDVVATWLLDQSAKANAERDVRKLRGECKANRMVAARAVRSGSRDAKAA